MVGRVPDTPATTLSLWQRVVPLPSGKALGAELKGRAGGELKAQPMPGNLSILVYANSSRIFATDATRSRITSLKSALDKSTA